MNSVTDNNNRELSDLRGQVAAERLLLAARQSAASCIVVVIAVCSLWALFRAQANLQQELLAATIVLVYLLRAWLGNKLLDQSYRPQDRGYWEAAFMTLSAASGAVWGAAAAMWISNSYSGVDIFVAFLIGGVCAGSILSLGYQAKVYAFFIIGLLAPVALAFVVKYQELGITLAALTLVYAAYLVVTAKQFRKRMDHWLHLGLENKNLIENLRAERNLSESRLQNLTAEIEERQKVEVDCANSRTTLANLLGNLPGMAYRAINDGKWSFEFISDGCQDILGLSAKKLFLRGNPCIADVLVSSDRRFANENFRVAGLNPTFQHEYSLTTPEGVERRVIERGRKVFDEFGKLIAIDGFITDISDQFLLSNKLSQLEKFDSLTGTYNRQQFEVIVQNTVYKSVYNLSEHILLYIDLDQFKIINDTCGHTAGDEMLREVVAIYHGRLRQQDILARLGGDEFGILLENCSLEEGTRIAEELCQSTKDFRFNHENRNVGITASIGVASTKSGLESLQHLMIAAENATYTAKEQGRNQVHVYQANDDLFATRSLQMQWAIEIPEAIQEDRMYLEWQKIVPVNPLTPRKNWYEILIRMRDRHGEPILPGAFLPAAEQYYQAILIDTWVVKTLLGLLDQQAEKFEDIDMFFVNLSGQTMGQPAFLENIYELLKNSRHSARRLCFEITETAAVANKNIALDMMQRLQQLGCRFALDDFGSGLSSFGYLRDFPVEYLKIDGEFVKNIADDPINRSIVASICDVGHATGKEIIAEFVENEDILSELSKIGADYAQGYGIAKPTSLNARRDAQVEW